MAEQQSEAVQEDGGQRGGISYRLALLPFRGGAAVAPLRLPLLLCSTGLLSRIDPRENGLSSIGFASVPPRIAGATEVEC